MIERSAAEATELPCPEFEACSQWRGRCVRQCSLGALARLGNHFNSHLLPCFFFLPCMDLSHSHLSEGEGAPARGLKAGLFSPSCSLFIGRIKMLRKRSRPVRKDQSKEHLMSQKTSCRSFPNVPGLLVGFTSKGSSDCSAVWSLTTPLDKVFSSAGNPNPGSPTPAGIHGRLKCWDSSRVGLGLLDNDEETKPCGEASGPSGNRNIVFGSQMRNNDSTHRPFQVVALRDESRRDTSIRTSKSLPHDYGILSEPKFGSPKPHSGSSGLVTKSFNNVKNYLHSEVQSDSNFQEVLGSLPIAFGSSHRLLGILSSSEIEQSEDYTCIISHGPDPKLTHIFGDCILESHIIGSPSLKKSGHKEEDSLSCSSCQEKLEEGKDIFMRSNKALCSCVCCDQEKLMEEHMEKPRIFSAASLGSSYHEEILLDKLASAL